MNTCCLIDFKTLISTTAGQDRIKTEYSETFNRPAVGHCESSLFEMYTFIKLNHEKIKPMAGKLKVKAGNEIQHIGGSETDLSTWSQKQIQDYLQNFPRARFMFEEVEPVEKKK